MPIARPYEQEPPQDRPGPQVRRPDEREHERDRARTGARDDSAPESGKSDRRGEVVPFPSGELARRTTPTAVVTAKAWLADARETASQAVDGSMLRARPPAIRDSFARLHRAEWAGGMALLRWAGWIYGYPIQVLRALLMCVLWLLDHPSRLLVFGGIVVAALAPIALH